MGSIKTAVLAAALPLALVLFPVQGYAIEDEEVEWSEWDASR